jgi:hypothetical protein
MRLNLRKAVCHSILAVGVAAALVTSAAAQDANIRSVTFYTVKPDRSWGFSGRSQGIQRTLGKGRVDSLFLCLAFADRPTHVRARC